MSLSLNLSEISIEDVFNKLMLTRTIDYETHRSLEDCILKLRQLQPNHDWNVHFGGPHTRHEVIISQFDDHSCYYDVSTLYRARRSARYSRTANVSGKLTALPETGTTRVTGEAKLNAVNTAVMIIAVILFLGYMLFANVPTFVVVAAIGILVYAGYSMVHDHNNLVRLIQEL